MTPSPEPRAPGASASADAAPALELRGVRAAYPGRPADRPVLNNIDLRLEAGDVLALIGPNGAGKSSLLRVAAGVLPPAAGRVLLNGRDLAALATRERARRRPRMP